MIVFLDYDGTLVPIVDRPEKAKITRKLKEIILKLSEKYRVVIVTGRDFKNFRNVFGKIPRNLYLITSHGSVLYKGEKPIRKLAEFRVPDVDKLKKELAGIEGVIVEKKEGSVAVHYRNVKGCKEKVKRIFRSWLHSHPPYKVLEGKEVVEAFYGNFNKGKGVENFLRFIKYKGKEVIYIGDDTTDRYALRVVRRLGGKAVYVGFSKPYEATKTLKNPHEVYLFLRSLLITSR